MTPRFSIFSKGGNKRCRNTKLLAAGRPRVVRPRLLVATTSAIKIAARQTASMGDSVDVFNVGRFSLPEDSRSNETVSPVATEDKNAVKVGQVVEKYGYQYLWTTRHMYVSELETWRTVGDDVADSAVQSNLKTRQKTTRKQSQNSRREEDLLTRLKGKCQRGAANNLDDGYDEAKQFMESMALPDWVDWQRVRRGQLFFLKHLVGASTCLLHISLIGGFGAPKINKVLLFYALS